MTTRRDTAPDGAAALPGEPKLRLREPVDILAAIPYVVGFHPTESAIVIGTRGKRLVFTARVDLPTADASEGDVRDSIGYLRQVVVRQSATGVVLVGYGPAERVTPVVTGLRREYERAGLVVLEALRAMDGRYWSYLCSDQTCCPPDGTPYDVNASPVPAQWTVAGRVALPDREAFEAQLKPLGGLARVSMRLATARADERLAEILAGPQGEQAIATVLREAGVHAITDAIARQVEGGRLDDDEVAWLTVLLASVSIRDEAWGRIYGSTDELESHRALWLDVMRRAERDLVAAPGCLFAFAAWRCGDGAIARLALEKVLAVEPEYSMAVLLHNALVHGLPPSALDDFPRRRVKRPPARRPRKRSSRRRAGNRRG